MSSGSTTTVFLSYRREDTPYAAGRLGDRLSARFGKVFMDIDNIDPGVDFTEVILQAVGECDVLVALIGDKWTSVVDRHGRRRLEDPDDWIVQEIRVALDRGIRVIPVLVDPARMPARKELPEILAPLANRQAVTLRHESFGADTEQLIAAIERALGPPTRPDALPAKDRQGRSDEVQPEPADPACDPDLVPALEAFYAERWAQAVELFVALLDRFPGNPDLTDKLDRATRQKQLIDWDADAQRAVSAGRWADAILALEQIVAMDRDYGDVAERLAEAKVRRRISGMQEDIRALHAAGRWDAVVAGSADLAALDPGAADPDGLVTNARAQLADADLAARYMVGVRQLDQGELTEAVTTFEGVLRDRPGYREAAAMLARAGQDRRPSPAVPELFVPEPRTLRVGQWVRAVAFSPDGTRLATGSRQRVRVWDLRTGTVLWQRKTDGFDDDVISVTFSPDGSWLASAASVGTAKFLDGIASIERPSSARVWDAVTGAERLKVTHARSVNSVAFSPDGAWLATGSSDGTARIWDAVTATERLKVTHARSVNSVAFSPDGAWLATGSSDGTARIWDAVTGADRLQITHARSVNSVAFSPDGACLATASSDGSARISDSETGTERLRLSHGWSETVNAVAFSPDGRWLATGAHGSKAWIWDAVTGAKRPPFAHGQSVNSVAFSPDGSRLAAGSDDKTARIWDATPGVPRGS